jgi:glyoxylase-like metal-dependent hydrolase (beta-lactamase superfamily II)
LRVSDQILRVAPDSLPGGAHRHSVESARPSRSAAYSIPISRRDFVLRFLSALCLLTLVGVPPIPARRGPLHLIHFTTGELSVNVSATVIVGPTEAILVDCLAFAPDAAQVADSIATLGTHLKAIYVTHADIDHYLGCAKLVERFPGTPVYMTPKALDRYKKVSGAAYAVSRRSIGTRATLPDSLVTVRPLPSNTLTVDGEDVVIHPDVQGDVIDSQNSFIWIPSLRAVLADDIVFNQVHAFLAAVTTEEGHKRWHEALHSIAALHPLVVVASHKKTFDTPNAPAVVDAMDRYITDFDAVRKTARDTGEFNAAMRQRYPDWIGDRLLRQSAAAAYGLLTLPY